MISLEDARAHRGADVGSDQNLVLTKAKLNLNSTGKKQVGTASYEESEPRIPEIRQQFSLELRNRFDILQTQDQNDTDAGDHQYSAQPDSTNNIEQRWQKITTADNETALSVLGRRKKSVRAGSAWKVGERSRKGGN